MALILHTLGSRVSLTNEQQRSSSANHRVIGLATEGTSWSQSLNAESLCWPAVRELLKAKYPTIFNRFAGLEKVSDSALSDIRLARKAGGFAYEYWCTGGDIRDVDQLLEKFNSMLDTDNTGDETDADLRTRQRVMDQIFSNVNQDFGSTTVVADDVWNLGLEERQSLLRSWKEELDLRTILDKTAEIHRRHQVAQNDKNKVRGDLDARCLEQQDVIAMTTTACAMNWATLQKIGLQTVICEEAGEVMEAQFLCTLFPTVEHSISIGDPLQLRPQVNETALSLESELGASYRLDESLMERLMLPTTPGVVPIPSSRLNIQRRMHPEIANLMRATLYPFLKDHASTHDREPVPVMADRVFWLDHQVLEDVADPRSSVGTSSSNAFEVEMTVGLVEHLVRSNEYDFRDITVLTPYNAQLAAFTERFNGVCPLWLSEKDREMLLDEGLLDPTAVTVRSQTDVPISSMLKLATIDNFQGEESRVIILSTVRSNLEGQVGFLRTVNRINVGCSRARNGFYIIGNASLMAKVEMWRHIIDELATQGKIGPAFRTCCPRHPDQKYLVESPDQWQSIPECQVPCHSTLACGHACKMKCHAPALHERVGCDEPCQKIHKPCGHACTKTCGEPCGDCAFPLQTVILSCGHEATRTCAEIREADDTVCNALLERVQLPCGHWGERHCSTANEPIRCEEKCSAILPCGHLCGESCSECTFKGHHVRCTSACSRELPCGHKCTAICHNGLCPPCRLPCERSCGHGGCSQPCGYICDPCVKQCFWNCPHTGFCTTMCCLPCDKLPCSEPCTELLSCGRHLCPSLCGEMCPKKCTQCVTGKFPMGFQMSLPCGHAFGLGILDSHVGISNLFDLDSTGVIQKARADSSQVLTNIKTLCPECGADFGQLRRYLFASKLSDLEGNLDRLYAKFSRKLYIFMDKMYTTKAELDQTFSTFCKTLKPSPLSGRTNEQLVRARGSVLDGVLSDLTRFKGISIPKLKDRLLLTINR